MAFWRTAGINTLAAGGLALAALTASTLFVAPASAQMPPSGRMFGFVQVDDHGAYDGTLITAHVDSTTCGSGRYDANRGLYIVDLDSSNDACGTAGHVVWFSVDSCTAYNTGTVPEFSGAQRVDLVAASTC